MFTALVIYPNPSNGSFTLEMRNQISNNITLELVDLFGKIIHHGDYILTNEKFQMQHDLNSGVYFLNVKDQTTGSVYHTKIVVK